MSPVRNLHGAWSPGRRRRVARRLAALIALSALIVAVAGCGSSGSGSGDSSTASAQSASAGGSSGSSGAGLTDVSIAYAAPIADQMLPSVTQAAGIFKKNGINAKITFLQSSALMPALVGGQVDFGVLGAPSAELAALQGDPLQYIAQWENTINAIWVASKDYPTIKSLDGKTVAISSPGSFSDFLVQIAEHRYGISQHEVPLGNLSGQVAAFSKGSVDSLSSLSPNQLAQVQSERPGAHTVIDWRDTKNYPNQGLVANQKWLSSSANRAVAVKVVRALSQGLTYWRTHPKQSIAVISKETEESPAQAKAGYESATAVFMKSIVPLEAAQRTVMGYLAPTNPKAKDFPVSKLLDASIAQQALGH